eukprot:CAMPEP_0197544976 /NCGR_PEP_ID=MMETSP1320-20131121/210_1 /TAXON_ID=91990 /ORGANISM="Bolidomonas sp., Strain RCC2347" /LENGTH=46 /DNA_ID= /DNA_START= /DNA_END= /DNA_ORIENTATION=
MCLEAGPCDHIAHECVGGANRHRNEIRKCAHLLLLLEASGDAVLNV